MTDRDNHLPEKGRAAREMWRSSPLQRVLSVTLLLSVAGNVAQGVDRFQVMRDADRNVRVIVVDPYGSGLTVMNTVDANWDGPTAAMWVHFAGVWLSNTRRIPLDEGTFGDQITYIRNHTDRRLYTDVSAWMTSARERYREQSVQLEVLSIIPSSATTERATVEVQWREGLLGSDRAKWPVQIATVQLARKPAPTEREFGLNPVGIYVVGFYHTSAVAAAGLPPRRE